jgi:hypothetical protein
MPTTEPQSPPVPPGPDELDWHRVLDAAELPEGRVTTVNAGHHQVALTRPSARRSRTTARR